MATAKRRRVCANGHPFVKSSDCPTCPICEAEKKPAQGFLSSFSAPARRALEHAGIRDVRALAKQTKKAVLALHGIGPASLPALERQLAQAGLTFRTEAKKPAPRKQR
jgi:DNA-directed RNA polymerase alpha subunit